MQKSPRMVPGLESAGLVSPSITRPVFTTFSPSQTSKDNRRYSQGRKTLLRKPGTCKFKTNSSRTPSFNLVNRMPTKDAGHLSRLLSSRDQIRSIHVASSNLFKWSYCHRPRGTGRWISRKASLIHTECPNTSRAS